MGAIPFTKVQGLGNDFIVVDLRPGREGAGISPSPTDPEVARALCDRRFGIGADGVLAILPGSEGDARMRVINSDGSEAEMCGNGIRCVAKFLYETDAQLRRPQIRIDTGAGLLLCGMDADPATGQVRSVSVEMGAPRLARAQIPMLGPESERVVRAALPVGNRAFTFTAVSMGNPHAVIFVDDVGNSGGTSAPSLMDLAMEIGPKIELDPLFPRRTNVELARLRSGAAGPEIDLVVWERGCGITLACGTGACATVVAACLEGRIAAGVEVPVHLPGGTLHITVTPGGGPTADFIGVTMRGPATTVFESEIDPGATVPGRGNAGGRA